MFVFEAPNAILQVVIAEVWHIVHVNPSRWYIAAVWKDDESLAEPEDLRIYVSKKFHRSKILDFMRRDYPSYNWSIATLDRWLRLFDIFYI